MNEKKMKFLFVYSAILTVLYLIAKRKWSVNANFSIAETDIHGDKSLHEENPPDLQGRVFDCPECKMPAEVSAIIVTMHEEVIELHYLVACLSGSHDEIPVTEAWISAALGEDE